MLNITYETGINTRKKLRKNNSSTSAIKPILINERNPVTQAPPLCASESRASPRKGNQKSEWVDNCFKIKMDALQASIFF